jgi:Uncharacterized conserved protein
MSRLQELLQEADSCKEKILSAHPHVTEEVNSLSSYFKIALTYSSNALEGNTLSQNETQLILENGMPLEGKPLKDCHEVTGHGEAFDLMLKLARQQNMVITEEDIQKLHRLFYQRIDKEAAGQYRTNTVNNSLAYIHPSPEDVPHLMHHIVDQILSSKTTLHPIELASMAHKRLLDIHPFSDGNGRIARLLTNLILVHSGYGLVIILPEQNLNYKNALFHSRQLNDMEPFSIFIAECVLNTQRDYCGLLDL